MPLRAYRRTRIHALLSWQVYALSFMLGLFAARYLDSALCMFGLLALATYPYERALRGSARLCLSGLVFCVGFVYSTVSLPNAIIQEPWISSQPMEIIGRVAYVEGLPDERLRIALEDVRPMPKSFSYDSVASDDTLDGVPSVHRVPEPIKLIWTWEKPIMDSAMAAYGMERGRPIAGEIITANLAIKPIRGLSNVGSFDIESFWAMKGYYYRAWSKGDRPQLAVLSKSDDTDAWFSKSGVWREWLRSRVDERIQALIARPAHDGILHMGYGENYTEQHAQAAGSIVMGILFGDRFGMESRIVEYFVRTDLLHSLALSGQHLIVAAFFATLWIFFIRYGATRSFLYISQRKLFFLLCLPSAAFYLWLGNAPPSLVRAACMLLLWTVLVCCTSRSANLLDVLIGAVFSIVLVSPLSVYDVGLQLSGFAVAALAGASPIIQPILLAMGIDSKQDRPKLHGTLVNADLAALGKGFLRPTWRQRAWQILCPALRAAVIIGITSALVQLVLLPIQLIVFGKASPWFLLNIIWMPLADFIVLPVSFAAMLCQSADSLRWLGDGCFWLAMQTGMGLIALLETLDNRDLLEMPALLRPHWLSAIGYAGLLICVFAKIGRTALPYGMRLLLLASIAFFLTGPALRLLDTYDESLRLHVIDVGLGQAIALRSPKDSRVLVDGGGFYSKSFDTGRDIVARVLTHNATPRIDIMLNSHPDNDHLRGLLYLLRTFSVGMYGYNGDDNAKGNAEAWRKALDTAGLEPQALVAGMTIPLDSKTVLEILHPQVAHDGIGNDGSLVMRVVHEGKGMALLCGDVEEAGIRELLATGADLRAEVLILPHHGSKSSYVPAFYDAVQPTIAIASCSYGHRYGYPNAIVREALAERHIPLYYTGRDGAVSVTWPQDGGPMEIDCLRHAKMKGKMDYVITP